MPFIRQSLRAMSNGVDPQGFLPFWLEFFKNSFNIHSGAVATNTELAISQYWFLLLLFLFFAGFSLYVWLKRRIQKGQPALFSRGTKSRRAWLGVITVFTLVLGVIYDEPDTSSASGDSSVR